MPPKVNDLTNHFPLLASIFGTVTDHPEQVLYISNILWRRLTYNEYLPKDGAELWDWEYAIKKYKEREMFLSRTMACKIRLVYLPTVASNLRGVWAERSLMVRGFSPIDSDWERMRMSIIPGAIFNGVSYFDSPYMEDRQESSNYKICVQASCVETVTRRITYEFEYIITDSQNKTRQQVEQEIREFIHRRCVNWDKQDTLTLSIDRLQEPLEYQSVSYIDSDGNYCTDYDLIENDENPDFMLSNDQLRSISMMFGETYFDLPNPESVAQPQTPEAQPVAEPVTNEDGYEEGFDEEVENEEVMLPPILAEELI